MNPVVPPSFPSMLTALSQDIEALQRAWQQAHAQRQGDLQSRPFWWRWWPTATQRHLRTLQAEIDSINMALSSRIRTGLLVGVEEWVHTSFTPVQLAVWKKQDVAVLRTTVELRNGQALANACLKADGALLHTMEVAQAQIDEARTSLLPVGGSMVADCLLDTIKRLHAFAATASEGAVKTRAQAWASSFPAFDTLQEACDHCQAVRGELVPVLMDLQAAASALREAHREAMAGKAVMEASVFVRVQDAMPASLVACERNPEAFWNPLPSPAAEVLPLQGLNAGRGAV